MAFFKFRKGTEESPKAPAQPQSIEAIRQRAKYRLAGATLLVLIGVVGLPMLFDKQPRPMAVDTPISIPDKNKVPALVIPAAPVTPPLAAVAQTPEQEVITEGPDKPAAEVAPTKAEAPTPASEQASISSKRPAAPVDKVPVATTIAKKPVVVEVKPAPVKAPAVTKPPVTEGRFVVQVGAFAETARAQEVRMKLERAGLKTYTQAAETKDGRRIRVRLGPFATRAEAEKAVEKVKKLSLPAALLTL